MPIEEIGDTRARGFERIHDEGNVSAVELAAVQNQARVDIDDRVVVDAVQLVLDVPPHPRQSVAHHADDVRRAAYGIPILQPRAGTPHLVERHVLVNPRRGFHLPCVRLDGEQARLKVIAIAP